MHGETLTENATMPAAVHAPGRPKMPAEARRVATSFRLPAGVIAKLARLASAAGVSQSVWIEQQVKRSRDDA